MRPIAEPAASLRLRRSARVLLFEPGGELLLLQFVADLDGKPFVFWVTPGGEVEPGEADSAAAARELLEELGVEPPLVGPVHEESGGTYTHLGETVRNYDVFFAAVCDREAPHLRGVTAEEIALMREARWWALAQLDTAAEPIFPKGLAGLAAQVWQSLRAGEG